MFDPPQSAMLADGKRLHLSQGPIDLIIESFGAPEDVERSYWKAEARFSEILTKLVAELSNLRKELLEPRWHPLGDVASRMVEACWPHRKNFVTPMAAVAGAVADYLLFSIVEDSRLTKAYVNNGGDIAFFLTEGERLTTGIVGSLDLPSVNAVCDLRFELPVRGIATSGWRGRSHSLGIADSVTVLAKDAASADVAATLIANSVNIEHPGIRREPADYLHPDSDLGSRLVTTSVPKLDNESVIEALRKGQHVADGMRKSGLLVGAALTLQGRILTVGDFFCGDHASKMIVDIRHA